MKKYIDADIVNLKLKQICDNHNTSYGIQFGGRAKDFAQLTDDIPAADVAEIVRCKDCKYFCEKEGKCYGQDIRAEEGHDCYKNDDDFCSCGERE